MDDSELAAIRAARMQQLQQEHPQPGAAPGGGGGGSAGGGADAAAKQEAEAQMRRDVLATVLEPDARARLARIALVAPARAQHVETVLLRMAQTGQLRGRVSEAQLIGLLEQAEEADTRSGTKVGAIKFQRRELDDDDDWDI